MSDESVDVTSGTNPLVQDAAETKFERYMDIVLGVLYLITAIVAAKRMMLSRQQQSAGGGAETYVVTAFYSLIGATSVLRTIWFLIPAHVWQPSYVPIAVFAWDKEHPSWVGAMLSEITVTAGSLTLFAIFILILVYWADILKKYFHPGATRSVPMYTFFALVSALLLFELVNLVLFLARVYTTEGMILYNAVLLAVVSLVCVCEITIFSHRFRTVLQTLGAINQVSTDSQVRRIVWITVTGNLFFSGRAILETVFAGLLVGYWHHYGSVDKVFSHTWWDAYTMLKYGSELGILALMLYILQSRFANAAASASNGSAPSQKNSSGYQPVGEAGSATVV
uniref:THH1/TOM1/TOM3 domain-containing protein n=1 Tax=Entomoneis paludosa TaxID=265537 RepID=A0A7S2YGE5_9STRA|mmetsp:Transcript_32010/g.66824  ORF Transcript_32010/g.66824 Transcript_32010/m.66824 type:complete len:338 (+) Transcript_32010:220-1233(+)